MIGWWLCSHILYSWLTRWPRSIEAHSLTSLAGILSTWLCRSDGVFTERAVCALWVLRAKITSSLFFTFFCFLFFLFLFLCLSSNQEALERNDALPKSIECVISVYIANRVPRPLTLSSNHLTSSQYTQHRYGHHSQRSPSSHC